MKRLLSCGIFFFLCVLDVAAESEQPVYEIKDPAISQNFQNLYYQVDDLGKQFTTQYFNAYRATLAGINNDFGLLFKNQGAYSVIPSSADQIGLSYDGSNFNILDRVGGKTFRFAEYHDATANYWMVIDGANNGHIGVRTTTPVTALDVNGVISLQDGGSKSRNGGLSTEANATLINFGINEGSSNRFGGSYTSGDQGGFLRFDTRAGTDFFQIWGRAAGTANASGSNLLNITSAGRVHIDPAGTPDVQLEVSNGSSTGGGTVHAASFAAHSSRALKSDISYLTETTKEQLYNDLKSLRPCEFRYKKDERGILKTDETQPFHKGLILEEVPQSLRRPEDPETISLNDQIFMLQAAVQVLINKVEDLEKKNNR